MASRKCSAKDFIFKEDIGHGSYSTVYKAYDKRNIKKIYAIKVCSKSHIIKEGKVKYVTIEKNTLNLLAKANHPGIVKLYYTFHDEQNLYFVLDFASGGELLSLLHKCGTFNENWSKHFTVQLIDTLSYIHSQGIIHRDLKPENVLLDKDGRLMVTDFGAALTTNMANKDSNEITSSSSFVGTAEYVSPELLLYNQCSYGSDIWALGCMIYQFFEGHPPFRGENELKTFEKIVALDYSWNNNKIKPKNETPPVVIDLVRRILIVDTRERLTLKMIKQNVWFNNINWDDKINIWKGIWQVQSDEGFTRNSRSSSQSNSTSSSYHRMIPNRQLHVIDTPVKNITITKQKRKKPTKVSNTTSSIVEWRKKLGISTNMNNNKSQSVDMTTDIDNINNDLIMTDRISSVNHNPQPTTTNNILTNGNGYLPPQEIKKSNGLPYVKEASTPTRSNRNSSVTMSNNFIPPTKLSSSTTPSSRQSLSSSKPSTPTQTRMKTPSPPPQPLPVLKHQQKKSPQVSKYSTPKLTTLNIFKQGYVYIHEIPYKLNGPGMSLTSYNKIDNDLITTFVADHHNGLRSSKCPLKTLILKKNGSLLYNNNSTIDNEQFMVNIGDSELSVYDFEFDELEKTGFLILEKYKHKIWFISLPSKQVTSGGLEINNKETWVDCFFRVRQLIENQMDQNDDNSESRNSSVKKDLETTAAKLNNVTINESKSTPVPSETFHTAQTARSPSGSTHTSSKNSGKISVPKNSTTTTTTTTSKPNNSSKTHSNLNSATSRSTSSSKPGSNTSNINSQPLHINTPKQRQTSTSSNKSRSVSAASNSNSSTTNHQHGSSPQITLPTTLRVNTNTANKSLHESKRLFSPPLRSKPFSMGSPLDMSNLVNSNGPTSPPLYPTKKYNAPKDMVISSSRYEVIHTLSNQHSPDQTVASSGASAAFKSLQRKRSGNEIKFPNTTTSSISKDNSKDNFKDSSKDNNGK